MHFRFWTFTVDCSIYSTGQKIKCPWMRSEYCRCQMFRFSKSQHLLINVISFRISAVQISASESFSICKLQHFDFSFCDSQFLYHQSKVVWNASYILECIFVAISSQFGISLYIIMTVQTLLRERPWRKLVPNGQNGLFIALWPI